MYKLILENLWNFFFFFLIIWINEIKEEKKEKKNNMKIYFYIINIYLVI